MAVNAEPKNTSSPASVTEVTDCLTDKVKRDRTKKKTDHVERLLVSSDGPGNERNGLQTDQEIRVSPESMSRVRRLIVVDHLPTVLVP